MALIEVEEKELEDMGKLIKEQARTLQEQRDLIDRMGFESVVNRGWVIRNASMFFTLEVEHMRLLMVNLASLKIPIVATDGHRAFHEKNLQESKEIFIQAQKKSSEANEAWQTFIRDYPVAAKTLLGRLDSEMKKEVI
jgi:hypothetical protein